VFALTNTTDKPIERWLVADRYGTVGSGVVWPDLDARRVDAVTPSVGFVPERIKNDRADVFRLTVEPGQTITFVAELASERYARLYLWKAIEYEQKSRDASSSTASCSGITGLLAIFLTAVFAANHKAIFPTAAIFTWCVLAYPVRGLRLLAQAVQRSPRGERAVPRRHRGGHGGNPSRFPLHLLAAGGLARLRAHAAGAMGNGPAHSHRRGISRSAARRHLRPPIQPSPLPASARR
jgi:hypothetical protein